jgi:tRNA U34 5-carboxymethylaminomethyl modifying GTPase MnmE/TrmE
VAFDLIAASAALEEIIGLVSPDDLLNRIFSNFCIGK